MGKWRAGCYWCEIENCSAGDLFLLPSGPGVFGNSPHVPCKEVVPRDDRLAPEYGNRDHVNYEEKMLTGTGAWRKLFMKCEFCVLGVAEKGWEVQGGAHGTVNWRQQRNNCARQVLWHSVIWHRFHTVLNARLGRSRWWRFFVQESFCCCELSLKWY